MFTWQVKWETLNGNIRTRKFYDTIEADKFYQHKQDTAASFGTQWVDIDQISCEHQTNSFSSS